MECPVCFSADATLTTRCGHKFCFPCMKQWLVKSGEESKPGCPMCRTTIRFKGLKKIEQALEAERYNQQCSDVFDRVIESIHEQFQNANEDFPEFASLFQNMAMRSLKGTEQTMRVLKEIDYEWPEVIEDLIEDGLVLNYKKELRRDRKHAWQQRDKFAAKYERKRVMKNGR